MTTALTGSLGWSGLNPLQLGGPPLINTFSRSIPAQATPFIAHAYSNDGVTPLGTLGPLSNRPALRAMLANGGYEQVTLETPISTRGTVYGAGVFGLGIYGGIGQGNIVRLSQQGGDGSFVYSGIVEALPDTIGRQTKHEIVLSPFGFELDDTYTQLVYSSPTDVATVVRQAVALTVHCSCDQVSVPPATGVLIAQNGQVDFRNQTVKQVIDTCRSFAGPTWYWHVDELGRVWFQPQGSGAVYTVTRRQYEERVSDGGSIQQLRNQVVAVGGVPTGGAANVVAAYNGSSQSTYGVRSLNPPLAVPNITDQASLQFIANNVGAVLDRVKTQVKLTVREGYGSKIHAAQPGGAMIRYWEPATDALAESESGSGTYSGPYVGTAIEWDGITQKVTAGDIAITGQSDVDNMVRSLVARAAANALQVTAAALNLQQTLTGSFQSGQGTKVVNSSGQIVPATLWSLNQQEFAAIDGNGVTRAEMGNLNANGISPAQWGFRANDAGGVPIFDSLGLISVMQSLGSASNPGGNPTFTTTTPTLIPSVTVTFSLTRALRVLAFAFVTGTSSGQTGIVDLFLDGVDQGSPTGGSALNEMQWGFNGPTVSSSTAFSGLLAAGSHTIQLRAYVSTTPGTFTVQYASLLVFQLGS